VSGGSTGFRHQAPGSAASAWDDHVAEAAHARLALVDREGAPAERVVVVAAHPDDETLGAGGLLATAGRVPGPGRVSVVVLTAGEASHPGSTTHTPERLAELRLCECREALGRLGPAIGLHQWDLADGAIASAEQACADRLAEHIGDGRGVLLVAPWRADGHPDHEAAGRAAAIAAARTGARLLEYPVWAWHWASPQEVPWPDPVVLTLDEAALAAKQDALGCHHSQVEPLSDRPGDERLLSADFLAHFARPHELFIEQPNHDPVLDRLHADGAEPWGADTRWYEERKRSLVLAMLPQRRYGWALDVGCSTGVTTQALADRCREVVAVDASEAAVRSARRRLDGLAHVSVEQRTLPAEWPSGRFDLVVVSEVGYFLAPGSLPVLVDRVADCLEPSGVVVLCHWRHRVAGWPLDGAAVHRAFEALPGRAWLASYRDRDVEILLLGSPEQMPDPLR